LVRREGARHRAMLRGCVAAALVCVASACGAQDEGVVLMDTSPRLHLADLVNIERTLQFAQERWLCSRDREALYAGLVEEWLRSDAGDRAQILEFSAVAPNLDQLPEDSRAAVRATIHGALTGATRTGRPLGEALLAFEVDVTTPVTPGHRVTRSQAKAWIEIQELLLSRALGAPLRIPDDLAAALVERSLGADQRAMEDSPGRLAHLTRGWFAGEATAADRALAAALGLPARDSEAPLQPYVDPAGLFEVGLPAGWTRRPELDPTDGGSAFAGPAGSVFVVSAAPSPREVAQGTRPVAAALSESLSALGDSERVTPMADERDLGASALLRRGDALLLVLHLRAPGDSALCAVVCRLPATAGPSLAPDVATLLGSFRFTEGAWRAGGTWQAAEALRRGDDTTRRAAERDLARVLREALGALAVHLFGPPTEDGDVSLDRLLEQLGNPPAPHLLDPPPDPMGGAYYG